MSTEDFQGYAASRAWQRTAADELVAGAGVVVGEYKRAFFGDQLTALLPVFARHGVQLWLPETNGPIDAADPTHRALTM